MIDMKIESINIVMALLLMTACSYDEVIQQEQESHEFTLTSEIVPFKGEVISRSGLDDDKRFNGTGFEDGDWIRLKIICPFVSSSEYGESTWGNSYDAFFLLKRSGSSWTYLTSDDHCDITGSYSYSGSPQVGSFYEAQQTPYVYMASTWSEEKNFKTLNGTHVLQYCHVFHADQRKLEHYKASDLLWAQQYMQTGAWNVHLNFEHKMACITFVIDDSNLKIQKVNSEGNLLYVQDDNSEGTTVTDKPVMVSAPLSANAVLTLAGMPDIDQQEIVVGDYYAEKSKINSAGNFNYKNKHSCNFDYNGKVIGIGVNVDADNCSYAYPMTGNPNPAYTKTYTGDEIVPNTGTYTAYQVDSKHYRMIVPPCKLTTNAQIWVRDGERRYKMQLERKVFLEGELYPVMVKL